MKTITLVFVFATVAASARILTVSNNPAFPAQYPDVQAAITAAAAGDTVFVHGSQFLYPDFTITKKLVLIGAGYNSNNQFNQATRVNNIYLVRDAGLQNANGAVITGFLVPNSIQVTGSLNILNLTIFRNNVTYLYTYNPSIGAPFGANWVIYNNIISVLYGGSGGSLTSSASNISVQNNFIIGDIEGFSQNSVLVDHNVFQDANALSNMYYATLTNNIFVMSTGNIMASNVNFNTFNNNLSLLSTIGPNAPTNSFLGGSNSGAGNLVGIDPQFVNMPNLNSFGFAFDYRLKPASAGHNAGTDGTDLGVYGGGFPYPSGGASGSGYDTSPLPPIPQVTEVNIQNATVQPGTPLNVNVKARINN
jgi:hypothetical protein